MANPNDNTNLGSGEAISNEYIDPAQAGQRRDIVPNTGYKVPRSKIAIGPYGQDWGDVDYDTPLPTADRHLRRRQEIELLAVCDTGVAVYARNYCERGPQPDLRGRHLDLRGVR
jgi:hypothetical protein